MICIGTGMKDSQLAVKFAEKHEGVWATVGTHPHGERCTEECLVGIDERIAVLKELAERKKVVAIGEIGLDYHYKPCDRKVQIELFEAQLQMACDLRMPIVFHVREAYEDFFAVIDGFSGIRGVVHSFSDRVENLEGVLRRGLYVGVNGLATFTKDVTQLEAYDRIPLEKLLLETDAPYLTPAPYRGKMNEPAYVSLVARWVAKRRSKTLDTIEVITTQNAKDLFEI